MRSFVSNASIGADQTPSKSVKSTMANALTVEDNETEIEGRFATGSRTTD
jgi:hypothetical protein